MNQIVLGRHNSELRFRLVEIAFKEILGQHNLTPGGVVKTPSTGIGVLAVELADAALTAMEKPEADTSPIVADLRVAMQDYLDSEVRRWADEPTTDPYVLTYREGVKAAGANALWIINRAMQPKPEADTGPADPTTLKSAAEICAAAAAEATRR